MTAPAAPRRPNFSPAPRPGGPGAPMRPCTSGRRSRNQRRSRRPNMTATLPSHLILDRIDAPFGAFLIATDAKGVLRAVDFWADEAALRRLLTRQYGEVAVEWGQSPAPIRRAFEDYFAGDIRALETVPVATLGTTFQRKV